MKSNFENHHAYLLPSFNEIMIHFTREQSEYLETPAGGKA